MKRISKTSRSNLITYLIVVLAFLAIQVLDGTMGLDASTAGVLVPVCAYVVVALALNLVVGVSGELSLGHAGFMSVGAFTSATTIIVLQDVVSSDLLRLAIGLVVAAAFAAVLGALIGIPVLRLRGDYLAIVTLAFGEIIKSLLNNFYLGIDQTGLHMSFIKDTLSGATGRLGEGGKMIIGGGQGITGMVQLNAIKAYTSDTTMLFTVGIVLVLVTLFVIFNLVNSRSGRAIMASRDNRIAAESVGINVTKYKMMAFVTSAALAGAGGALWSASQYSFAPLKFDYNNSIQILVYVVLGGIGSMRGSIIATTFLYYLSEVVLRKAGLPDAYRMLAYAVALIVVMIATNSSTVKALFGKAAGLFKRKKETLAVTQEGGAQQ